MCQTTGLCLFLLRHTLPETAGSVKVEADTGASPRVLLPSGSRFLEVAKMFVVSKPPPQLWVLAELSLKKWPNSYNH